VTVIPHNDSERFELVTGSLYTPVLGDVLDSLGRVHQFLPAAVQPMLPSMMIVGRAMPVLVGDVFGAQAKPFGRLTEALDALQPGNVYLSRRGRLDCAAWGEIMTTAARTRGAAGAVIDGYHRDTDKVLEQNFPVFSRGGYGQDSEFVDRYSTTSCRSKSTASALCPGTLWSETATAFSSCLPNWRTKFSSLLP